VTARNIAIGSVGGVVHQHVPSTPLSAAALAAALAAAEHHLAALPLDATPPPGPLPEGSLMSLLPNAVFVGREATLQQIAHLLKPGGSVALTGAGGMGKTQLAVEFAHRFGPFFAGGVFWLETALPDTLPGQVAACGGPAALNLPGWPALATVQDKAALVMHAWHSRLPRLLIFDNLDDPASIPAVLKAWRPSSGGARLLITTRYTLWPATRGVQALPVRELARPDSRRVLCAPRAADDPARLVALTADPAADAICDALGDLPLALALAGGYLGAFPRKSLPDYQQDLQYALLAHRSLSESLEDDLPTAHATNVAATFALSYHRLDAARERDALARTLLRRAALLAPAPPPPPLLWRLIERDPAAVAGDGTEEEALRQLYALSLLTEENDGAARLHRLLAVFLRDDDPPSANDRHAVERALNDEAHTAADTGDVQCGLRYVPHLRHAIVAAAAHRDDDLAALLNNLATLLKDQGDYGAARPLYEQTLAIVEQALGPEHPGTAASLNNLALLLQAQGDYGAARPLYEQTLAIVEQALGPEHPGTAASLSNLALLLQAQGDYGAARPLYERALAIVEQALGPEHPGTAASLSNLALLLQTQGDYGAARPLFERALTIRERVLGPEHPNTATTLINLAALLRMQGDYDAARPLFEHALAIVEHTLGPEHPNTATSLSNLALLLQVQGDYGAARPLFERALTIRERVLGPEHPDTATTLNNLAALLQAQGDYGAARPLYERALTIRERVLGPEHPDTGQSLNNLASLLQAQGDYDAARPLFERTLAIVEHTLGPEHPNTATSLNNLATLLKDQGDYGAARPLFERALTIRERVLGPEHPDTAASLNNLALLLQAQGDYGAAHLLVNRALAIAERALGTNHPFT